MPSPFELPPVPASRRLYAFTIPDGGGPTRCLDFADDEDGRHALARHCRSDRVIKVIYGSEVEVDRADVVHLKVGDDRSMDTQPLMQ